MSRLAAGLIALASLLLFPAASSAQGRDTFVAATVHFIQASEGEFGDEGRYVTAALDEMGRALADWDAALTRTAAALTSEAVAAPPAAAASMHTALAAAYLERGQFTDALEQLERATHLAPALTDAYLLKGLVLERLGRAEASAAAYRAASSQSGENLAGAYIVAAASLQSGADRAAAAAAAGKLLAAVMTGGAARLVFPTDSFLDDASSAAPLLPVARYAPAFALLRQAKYGDALAALRAAAASDPLLRASSPDLVGAGGALRAGDAAGAIERGSAPLASRTGSGQAHRVLGRAYQASGDVARAIEHLRQAVRLDPEDERARLALSSALVAAGRSGEARVALADAIRRLPASGQAQWQMGQLAVRSGDWPAAAGAFEAAARLGPLAGAAALHEARARVFAQQRDPVRVRQAYRDRVAAIPHDSRARLDLGGAYRAAGLLDAALLECLAAALLDPANADTRATCGEILADLGRDADAAALGRRTGALDPRR